MALVCLAVALGTDFWETVNVDRVALGGLSESELSQDEFTNQRIYYSRNRGLFRVCFPGEDTQCKKCLSYLCSSGGGAGGGAGGAGASDVGAGVGASGGGASGTGASDAGGAAGANGGGASVLVVVVVLVVLVPVVLMVLVLLVLILVLVVMTVAVQTVIAYKPSCQ